MRKVEIKCLNPINGMIILEFLISVTLKNVGRQFELKLRSTQCLKCNAAAKGMLTHCIPECAGARILLLLCIDNCLLATQLSRGTKRIT